jgi:mannose-6-phosphate isomerase-like protein (cupin superfamily)
MIKNKENTKHYFWGNNCESWILMDSENLSIKSEKMPANTCEKMHFHKNSQQFFYILKGKATFFIDEVQFEVGAQNGISIEPLQKHFIENNSSEILEFLVISNPSTNNDRILI